MKYVVVGGFIIKKFKLLKDLPTLRAGIVFTENPDGIYCNCIVVPTVRPNVKPHYQFEPDAVENNPVWFEEVVEDGSKRT